MVSDNLADPPAGDAEPIRDFPVEHSGPSKLANRRMILLPNRSSVMATVVFGEGKCFQMVRVSAVTIRARVMNVVFGVEGADHHFPSVAVNWLRLATALY
jgi:hypothetical protein